MQWVRNLEFHEVMYALDMLRSYFQIHHRHREKFWSAVRWRLSPWIQQFYKLSWIGPLSPSYIIFEDILASRFPLTHRHSLIIESRHPLLTTPIIDITDRSVFWDSAMKWIALLPPYLSGFRCSTYWLLGILILQFLRSVLSFLQRWSSIFFQICRSAFRFISFLLLAKGLTNILVEIIVHNLSPFWKPKIFYTVSFMSNKYRGTLSWRWLDLLLVLDLFVERSDFLGPFEKSSTL